MDDTAVEIIRTMRDESHLRLFLNRLSHWLTDQLNQSEEQVPSFTESRARALLRAADVLDRPTVEDFASLIREEAALRVAAYDLLDSSDLAGNSEIAALASSSASQELDVLTDEHKISWMALSVAAYAYQTGYYLYQLDPASPPAEYSPAGQVLKRAAHFVRRQVQRSATERDKLAKKLAGRPAGVASLEELTPVEQQVAPLPPHYRPPVPESYPEFSRDTLHVDPDETPGAPQISIGDPIVISEEELGQQNEPTSDPIRMPAISIDPEQVPAQPRTPPSPMPSAAVVMPNSTVQSRPSFTMALRQMLGQEELTSTKLRVLVQKFPDGPGLYGLQVRVTCKGIRSYVAGTTDRDGKFVCELPVRLTTGLTYDVDVSWPREFGGEVERKSITLNADRTQFTLPFYRQLSGDANSTTSE